MGPVVAYLSVASVIRNEKFYWIDTSSSSSSSSDDPESLVASSPPPGTKFKQSICQNWCLRWNIQVPYSQHFYRNDISIKSSNVKLNINDVCNLIRTLKARSNASILIKKLIKRKRSNLF